MNDLETFDFNELSGVRGIGKGKIEDINTKLNNICTTDGDE